MKPRIDHKLFLLCKTAGTLANLFERYVTERSQPGARPLGLTQGYTYRRLQGDPIGAKQVATMKPTDFLDHCKARRAAGVLPQTVNADMTAISTAIKYAVEIWGEPEAEAALAAYAKAKPQMVREQLIGKSQERDRRPTPDELERILALAAMPPKKMTRLHIPMVPIIKMSYLTGRRISETLRLLWADLNAEKRTCIIRDLKNSKGKGFHGEFPLLGEAWDIVQAQPRTHAKIFPRNVGSVKAKYTKFKKVLGIENLRLHDNRRECFSKMFEDGYSVPEVQQMSKHRNPTILLKTYTALRPESLHLGPASKRAAA